MKFIVLGAILLASCSNKRHENNVAEADNYNCIKFYEDGTILSFGDTVNGEYEGVYKEFYENGNIRLAYFFTEGLLNGHRQEFYENGNPEIDMCYKMDQPMGVQYTFFEFDSARIKEKYIMISSDKNDTVIVISDIRFNEKGDTISDKSRVKISLPNDTFNIGDKITMKLALNNPKYPNYRVCIGNYDRNLNLIDSVGYQIYTGYGYETNLEIVLNKKGRNIMRGYMEDFEVIKTYSDGRYITIGTLDNWFDVDFFVK